MDTSTGEVYWKDAKPVSFPLRVAIDPETREAAALRPEKRVRGSYIVGNDRYYYEQ